MDEKHVEDLKRVYRVATIIGIAMISSLFIYAFIVEFIKVNVNININLPLFSTILPLGAPWKVDREEYQR